MSVFSKEYCEKMRVRIDCGNMLAEAVGKHGITAEEISEMLPRAEGAFAGVEKKRGEMRWRLLPETQLEILPAVEEAAEFVRSKADNFVILGIGGSALGPIAVHRALNHLYHNDLPSEKRKSPRLFVEDNVDPERMAALLDVIDTDRTVFNVITKSGSTSETMAQLLIITRMLIDRYGEEGLRDHLIATTDKQKGNLIGIAKKYNLRTFIIPDGVGGRFSELCPVGLVAAAVGGADVRALLAGAGYMDELCSNADVKRNPGLMLALLEIIAAEKHGANIGVLMPYADSLKFMADWYAQLWAESLGKRTDNGGSVVHTGQTPVKALGVTDQHSQVQLYTEGPFDKVITFIGVDKYRSEVTIPHSFDDIADVAFLSGHSFNELIKSEQMATEYAVTRSGHMNKTITLPVVNPFTIGELLYFFEIQTAYAGELLNINAFDQPGVEEGKNATYALLGKHGYDEKRRELDSAKPKKAEYIF